MNNAVSQCGRLVPVLFIGSVVGWSYYTMMYQVLINYYGKVINNIPLLVFLLLIFNIISILFIWSWIKTVITKAGSCNNDYKLSKAEYDKFLTLPNEIQRNDYLNEIVNTRRLTVRMRQDNAHNQNLPASLRFCRATKAIKPDRSHYCSMTKQLILKMDHYCPWVANCIGYGNYKFFVLFLFYAVSYCISIASIGCKPFLLVWADNTGSNEDINEILDKLPDSFKIQMILVYIVASVFSLSLICLFGFHLMLVSKNRSTIECYGAPYIRNIGRNKKAFDQGCANNWRQVFGHNLLLAFLPVNYDHPDLDGGHVYPLNPVLRTNMAIDSIV